VVARALPVLATGVDKVEEAETHLQQALLASMLGDDRRKLNLEIPVPVVNEVSLKDQIIVGGYKQPSGYVRFHLSDIHAEDGVPEYEADFVDENWLEKYNESHSDGHPVTLDSFEVAFDKLEKAQGFKSELLPYSSVRQHLVHFAGEDGKKSMYEHWAERRRKRKCSFLRLFQRPPEPHDINPAVAFRPREQESSGNKLRARSNTYDNFKKAVTLRRDFERARTLLEQQSKRERIKKDLLLATLAWQRKKAELSLIAPKLLSSFEGTRKKRRLHSLNDGESGLSKKKWASGADTDGFDDSGSRFLKHVRYFAGGFAANGVSPFDHRVFAAASTRNTAQEKTSRTLKYPRNLSFVRPSGPVPDGIPVRARFGRGGRIIFDRTREEDGRVEADSSFYQHPSDMKRVYSAGMFSGAACDENRKSSFCDILSTWPSRSRGKTSDASVIAPAALAEPLSNVEDKQRYKEERNELPAILYSSDLMHREYLKRLPAYARPDVGELGCILQE